MINQIPPKIPSFDKYWLAGLFEGEGCFTMKRKNYPIATISMTDKDVIERAAKIVNHKVTSSQPKTPNRKRRYTVSLCGYNAIRLMEILYRHMGHRRQSRITEILNVNKHI